jgi:two-component system, OmpR family, response regulator
MRHKVLVIEDSIDLAEILPMHLHDADADVEVARDGRTGLERATQNAYDLIILDLGLPELGGLEICRRLRAADNYTPILMLTSRSAELDRVLGFKLGADDYLTKPFSIPELIARVKAIFRRRELYDAAAKRSDIPLSFGSLKVDTANRTVTVDGRDAALTEREFDLLVHFARSPGRVFSRAELLDHVWGQNHDAFEHTVNSHINRLRAKIETDPADPRFVVTVWGVGYKFDAAAEAQDTYAEAEQ